jgi:phage gp29-like protein
VFNWFKKKPQPPQKRSYRYAEKPMKTLGQALGTEIASRERVDFSVILGQLPDPDEILIGAGKDFTVYRNVMIDSQVRACANSRKAGTMSLLWEIDRGKSKSKQAKLIEDLYNDLDIDALNSAILNAPLYGFQPIEIIWGKVGSYILPVALKAKNQEWFVFGTQGELRLLTVQNMILGEALPERKFLAPTYNDIHNKDYNPYGDRILSSCFWPVTFKKSGFKWWVTFAEKYGMPYIVGKMPRNTLDSERENMKDQLEGMVMDAVAVITDDSAVEFIEPSGKTASGDLYKQLINECDQSISKAILGQTLTTDGNQGGAGSYALGKVHSGVREDIVLSDKKIVEKTHNQLIKWITEINFGAITEAPKFIMYQEEDVDEVLARRDSILVAQGVKFNKDYYVESYNLSDKHFEVSETSPRPEPKISDKKDDSEFTEAAENDLDVILAMFADAQLQNQIEEVLRPVLKLVKNGSDYSQIKKELNKINPEMPTDEIEKQLTSILALSETLGRFDVKKKDFSR